MNLHAPVFVGRVRRKTDETKLEEAIDRTLELADKVRTRSLPNIDRPLPRRSSVLSNLNIAEYNPVSNVDYYVPDTATLRTVWDRQRWVSLQATLSLGRNMRVGRVIVNSEDKLVFNTRGANDTVLDDNVCKSLVIHKRVGAFS